MSHAADFSSESGDEAKAQQLIYDYRAADLSPDQRALCDYAVELTLRPGAMGEKDVETLRAAGWTDEQIHLAAQVIGYFNYINRIADGLGVDLESWMPSNEAEWRREKASWSA